MPLDRRTLLSSAAAAGATVAFAGASSASALDVPSPIVASPAGRLRGLRRGGLDIYTGIPFAATTAGQARFRPPTPLVPWSGVHDATRTASISPQSPIPFFPTLPGTPSEDCLQLSIWAPTTPGPHPVLVWIHGGGNTVGSIAEPLFDLSGFARDGVVAVALNYRLGALGFLELGGLLGESYRGSGNNAILDQKLGLEWVQKNISAFGGDPAQVTVAGESAGGYNIVQLLATPGATDLFQRAIISSGGQKVNAPSEADAFAAHFVEKLGGADRLLSATSDEILKAQGEAASSWPDPLPFSGVLDPKTLPRAPLVAAADGEASKITTLIGWCRDETRLLIPPEAAANPAFKPPPFNATQDQIMEAANRYGELDPELSRADTVWKATTAASFAMTSLRLADSLAEQGARVFKYRLDYTVENGPFGDKTPHGFDVPLVFEKLDHTLATTFGFSEAERPMAVTMLALWSSFVRTGVIDAGLPEWPTYDAPTGATMVLDRNPRVVFDAEAVDRVVWRGVL